MRWVVFLLLLADVAYASESIEGFSVSGKRMVQWDETTIFLSRDDGRTFDKILTGRKPLRAVTLVGSRVVVVRGGQLGIWRHGKTTWSTLPKQLHNDGQVMIGGRGTQLIIIKASDRRDGKPLVHAMRSRDWGRTWKSYAANARIHGTVDAGEASHLRVHADGTATFVLQWGQGLDCGVSYYSWFRLGKKLRERRRSKPDGPGPMVPTRTKRLIKRAKPDDNFSFAQLDARRRIYGFQWDKQSEAQRVIRWERGRGWKFIRPKGSAPK